MWRFKRAGYTLEATKPGSVITLHLDLVILANYWLNHSNKDFFDKYGFDWPVPDSPHDIVREHYLEKLKKLGKPSKEEIAVAINQHASLLERLEMMLQASDLNNAPRHLKLSATELTSFDNHLQQLVDRYSPDHSYDVFPWHPPYYYANKTWREFDNLPENKGEKPEHIHFLKIALLKSKAFFECFLDERENGGIVNYNITITDVIGPVNVLSRLEEVAQSVSTAPSLSSEIQDAVSKSFEELKTALSATPESHTADAELISEQAEAVAEELKKPKPRQSALKIKASGLIEAANALKEVVPIAVEIAKRITKLIVTGD